MKFSKVHVSIAAAVAVLVAGAVYFKCFAGIESTDDAQVAGHVAILSAKVPGMVAQVLIEENQKAKKGDVLVRLDVRDFENTKAQLSSELSSTEAKLIQARKNFVRSQNLFANKAIPAQELEVAQSQFDELKAKANAIRTQLKQSELNLEFAEIRAPEDGTIGKKSVEPGMVVSTTQPLMAFVASREKWITANFKETQLRRMKVGDKVALSIDSIEGGKFSGEVESLAPGTGAMFALIPPDNATGNYTKIVQRLPVRIKLDPKSIRGFEERIVPGLSADVNVYLQ